MCQLFVLLGLAPLFLAAREIRIARSTIPKKNNDYLRNKRVPLRLTFFDGKYSRTRPFRMGKRKKKGEGRLGDETTSLFLSSGNPNYRFCLFPSLPACFIFFYLVVFLSIFPFLLPVLQQKRENRFDNSL